MIRSLIFSILILNLVLSLVRADDKPEKAEYPLPLYVAEKDNCQVGRIRKDCAMDNGLCFWVSGDQLLKGAALNAVQIAEELLI